MKGLFENYLRNASETEPDFAAPIIFSARLAYFTFINCCEFSRERGVTAGRFLMIRRDWEGF